MTIETNDIDVTGDEAIMKDGKNRATKIAKKTINETYDIIGLVRYEA